MKKSPYSSACGWIVSTACLCITAANAQTPQTAQAAAVHPAMRGDGPAPEARPFSITKADPALDSIIAPDAKLQLLGDRFGLTEGPVWVRDGKDGYLLISEMLGNVIYKVTADKEVSVFLDKAGYSGDDINNAGIQTRRGRMHVLMIGPECTTLDSQGRLVWCASNDGKIMRLEKDGTRTVLADTYEGKRFNGPNDAVIRSDGAIYFTDPDFALRYGPKSPQKQLPFDGVWLVKGGKPVPLLDSSALGGNPNGIALSPDEKFLYLTAGSNKLMRYAVNADGSLGRGALFAEGAGIGDGLKVDRKGDIFSTGGAGPGVVRITSPEGKFLGAINLPISDAEPKAQICATNDAFGGNDAKTLYITACEAVYKIQLRTPGVVPGPAR
jgi:gluconolactonase